MGLRSGLFLTLAPILLLGISSLSFAEGELPPEAQALLDDVAAASKAARALPKAKRKKLRRKAISKLETAHAIAPDNAGLTQRVAELFVELEEHKRALKVLKALVSADAPAKAAVLLAVSCHEALRTHKKAEKLLLERLEADPSNDEFQRRLLYTYWSWENWGKMIKRCRHLLETSPDDLGVQISLAQAYKGAGDLPRALEAIDAAVVDGPKDHGALAMASQISSDAGDADRTIKYANRYLALPTKNAAVRKLVEAQLTVAKAAQGK